MSTTLYYEDYSNEQFEDVEYPLSGEGRRRTIAGVSPFDVPDAVQIEIHPEGTCRFRFSYPDKESEGQQLFEWPGDTSIAVKLGIHSQRVIELYVLDALLRLKAGNVSLDPQGALSWCGDAPPRIKNSALRNAEVIVAILATTPPELRESIVGLLQSLQSRTEPPKSAE